MTRRLLAAALFCTFAVSATAGCDQVKGLTDKLSNKDSKKSDAPFILTGSKKGNYFKAASELNEVLGKDLAMQLMTSDGSYGNLKELGQGNADYALVQFDTLIMFLRMGDKNAEWANNSLAIAPLSNELIHVIVNKKAKIRKLQDLKGKRLAAGSERSGSFVSGFTLMMYLNDVNLQTYAKTQRDSYEDSLKKLQSGALDALFITTTAGMPLLKQLPAGAASSIEILDVGTNIKLPKEIGFYEVTKLPKGTYPWHKKDTNVLATPSYLFAKAKLSSAKTRKVAKAIYENADKLKKKSKLWSLVSKERAKKDMKRGIGFHAGVKAYFASDK